LQAKLLRVLQEKSFERVGSSETRQVGRARLGHDQPQPTQEVCCRAVFVKTLFYPALGK